MARLTTRQQSVANRLADSLAPSARELFPYLRDRLLSSRPLIAAERKVEHRPPRGKVHPHRGYNVQTIPAVFGRPTFRNVLERDGEGRWVHV